MSTTEETAELIDRVWEDAWNNGKLDVIDEAVSEDYVLYDPAYPEEVHGPQGFKEYVRRLRTAFPDLSFTIDDRIVGDAKIVDRFTGRGTHEGEFMGIDPTGAEVENDGIVIHYVEGGNVVKDDVVYDALGMLAQLGVVEPPGE